LAKNGGFSLTAAYGNNSIFLVLPNFLKVGQHESNLFYSAGDDSHPGYRFYPGAGRARRGGNIRWFKE
jgi:hypothetical protein